jgi:adenylylsulfate kinase-like enzyme
MIVVLFGQPNSGKTTLGVELTYFIESDLIDGDHLREIFNNTDYSYQGRINNLKRASDIATYMDRTMSNDVILSLVYPYKEARDYLNSLVPDVKWVYLHYTGERGREEFHVKDFEFQYLEEKVLQLNTSRWSVEECVHLIKYYINENSSKG